jgi:bacillopeptidase F (M6 metalloprotease family)
MRTSFLNQKSHKNKRAQVGIEFLIIAGLVIFFISLFLLAIQNNHKTKITQHQNIQLKEIAITVQNEINLASKSIDGYKREFEIPKTAGNKNYEIIINSGMIYIKTTDEKYALALPVKKIIGNINKTKNTIRKINGQILLNQ